MFSLLSELFFLVSFLYGVEDHFRFLNFPLSRVFLSGYGFRGIFPFFHFQLCRAFRALFFLTLIVSSVCVSFSDSYPEGVNFFGSHCFVGLPTTVFPF